MMNLRDYYSKKTEWQLAYDGRSADKIATYFAFPAYATNAEINAKLEQMFFKTPYMDWFIMNGANRVAVYVNAEEYAEWKREQDDDSDDEESDDEESDDE